MNVVGYVRVSTENQIENYSIEEQSERIKSYCKAKGWNLIKIYTDGGYSGGNVHRPALQQMISNLTEGKMIDAVIVYKLDRLSRSQKDTLTLIEDSFLANKVDFVSINENFDTATPFGRAMIGILSVFAQLEKDQITERFTMGRIARGKAGYYHGGAAAPFGYDYIDGKLIVNAYEAEQVKEVYAAFTTGKTINAIYKKMQTEYGGTWSARKVANILRNSVYTGKIKFAGVEYEGQHESIISDQIYNTANKFLSSSAREAGKRRSQLYPFRSGYLLSGLIKCGRCGARYSAEHGRYTCYSKSKTSSKYVIDPHCKNKSYPIEMLDKYVVDCIYAVINEQNLSLNADSSIVPAVNTDGIKKQINSLSAQIERVIDLYQVNTAISIEDLKKRLDKLSAQRIELERMLANSQSNDNEKRRKEFLDRASKFIAQFDTADIDAKRMLVRGLVDTIIIDGDIISLKYTV